MSNILVYQVVTVEPGGLSRDHDDKIRLLIVSMHSSLAHAVNLL